MRITRIKKAFSIILCAALAFAAVFCVASRAETFFDDDRAAVMAAALTMGKGNFQNLDTKPERELTVKSNPVSETVSIAETEPSPVFFDQSYYNSDSDHGDAQKLPIYTKHYTDDGEKCRNFYVKNYTNYSLDIEETLTSALGFKPTDGDEIQVLVYHTHTGESYIDKDEGFYYSDYYPRTNDERYNVVAVGDMICQSLEEEGIGVIHDKTIHDASYNGSYDRSMETVKKYLNKYPSIKVTLDIHRDSIGTDDYKIKPTFTYDGKNGAQIMIMSGYDEDGSYNFPDWKKNLTFALKLQESCESNFSGMTRPLNFGDFVYNMNANTGSLLIEVGTDANTLSEAKLSGKLLGKALAQVLQNSS